MSWSIAHLTLFVPVVAMVVAFTLNQAAMWRRSSRQVERDARRLRAALLAELGMLRRLVAENLLLIRQGEEYLLSFRVLIQVYRANVGRLSLLHEAEIQAVIHAYGITETAEVFVGAVTKPHGAHSYRVWLGDRSWEEIERRLSEAGVALDAAIGRLERVRRHLLPLPPGNATALPLETGERWGRLEQPERVAEDVREA